MRTCMCQACGHLGGCTDFIYQPNNHVCVLLPFTPPEQMVRTPNPFTISGSVTIRARVEENHRRCALHPAVTYTEGMLPAAFQPNGEQAAREMRKAISSEQECCDICHRTKDCAKFSFQSTSKACQLFYAFADPLFSQVCMCMCACACGNVCMCMCECACGNVCMCMCECACGNVCMCMCECAYGHTCMCARACMHVHVCMCMCM